PEPEAEQPKARGGPWAGDEASGQPAPRARASNRQGMGEAFAKSMLRTIGSQVGRELIRGVLGGLVGASRPTRRRRY
ncbi:MAG TPA: helicase HerA-like domain-containing protein, partial [Phenylobacterium sp.]|nr:helicase HerA-like domain-containing protein [Phenylobacterium sp.]